MGGAMKRVKKVLLGLLAAIAVAIVCFGVYAYAKCAEFDASMDKVYDVPVPTVARSTDPAVLARGKHLVEAMYPCVVSKCHGKDLGGGETLLMGPLATFTAPNITAGGLGAAYSDGELARLLEHGIKKDGRSLRFMPVQDFGWMPEADIVAIVSYVRTFPAVERSNGATVVKPFGKVIDRQEKFVLDVARHVDHAKNEAVPAPEPTVNYGRFVGRLCTGCHGDRLSGGRIPGSPPEIPTPLNLTPHATGMAGYTFEQFDDVLVKGVKRNGARLADFMPIDAFGKMDDTEKHALFAYLQSLPPTPFGNR
jgi:mono/diheme cytochrome c family protein